MPWITVEKESSPMFYQSPTVQGPTRTRSKLICQTTVRLFQGVGMWRANEGQEPSRALRFRSFGRRGY